MQIKKKLITNIQHLQLNNIIAKIKLIFQIKQNITNSLNKYVIFTAIVLSHLFIVFSLPGQLIFRV